MSATIFFESVLIAGVGLIGGSVAKGLRERFLVREIVGLDSDPETLTTALGLGVIDTAHLRVGDWVKGIDLVILAVPVRALPGLLSDMMPYLSATTILTDVGSVKAPLLEAISGFPNSIQERFVGGHPMAGSERAGVQNSSASLLQNAIWVLTPTAQTQVSVLERVQELVAALGANPVVLEPLAHDKLVATVSHLPYLSALALTRLIARHEDRDGLALLAAGGFRDLTRVASGDPRMSRDMVVENRSAVREAIKRYRNELGVLEEMLETPELLLEAATEGKRSRDSLPVVRRSLLPGLHDVVVLIPDQPGEFARITTLLGNESVNIKDIEVLVMREQGGAVRLGFSSLDEANDAKSLLERAGYPVRGR
jgi:prephenate dehydrogenase